MKYFLLLIIFSSIQLFSSDWKHVFDAEAGRIVKINYVDSKYSYFNCTSFQNNKIFKSSDLGITWDKIYDKNGFENKPPLFNYQDFYQIDTNLWFLPYADKYTHKTTDGGKTFETIQIGERGILQFAMYNSQIGITRNEGGKIYYTNDGWKTNNELVSENKLFNTEKDFFF